MSDYNSMTAQYERVYWKVDNVVNREALLDFEGQIRKLNGSTYAAAFIKSRTVRDLFPGLDLKEMLENKGIDIKCTNRR